MSLIEAICLIKKYRPKTFRRMSCMLKELIKFEIGLTYKNDNMVA